MTSFYKITLTFKSKEKLLYTDYYCVFSINIYCYIYE